MRAGRSILLAAVLGAATTFVPPLAAWWTMGAVPRAREQMVLRDGYVWYLVERADTAVRWINLESLERLVNPLPNDGAIPAWAEPAPKGDERITRTATLAVGWPFPALACSWRTERNDENFPPPATGDDSGWAPKDAMRRMLTGDGHPSGARWVLWGGFAIDAALLAAGWWVLLAVAGAWRARRAARGVTPRG